MTAMQLVALVSHEWDVLLALFCGGGFGLAFALGTQRMNGFVAVTLFLLDPLVAIATWMLVNPDPGCTDDCPGKWPGAFSSSLRPSHGGLDLLRARSSDPPSGDVP
jgi:hypothetical protein